jgi:hypothetical protein
MTTDERVIKAIFGTVDEINQLYQKSSDREQLPNYKAAVKVHAANGKQHSVRFKKTRAI